MTGGNANDSAPTGNNGVISGTVNWQEIPVMPAYTDYAAHYKADAAYTTIAGISDYNFGTNDFSIEVWCKTTSGGIILSRMAIPTQSMPYPAGMKLAIESNGQIAFVCSDGTTHQTFHTHESVDANDGAWHHIGVERDSGNIAIYFDGVVVTSSDLRCELDITPTDQNEVLAFGTRNLSELLIEQPEHNTSDLIPPSVKAFNLSLATVSLWDIARGGSAVFERMKVRYFGDETGLIGYWNFATGNITDSSINQNVGVVTSSAIMQESTLAIRRPTYALDLTSGTDQSVVVPAIDAYEIAEGDFTVEAWFKTTEAGKVLFHGTQPNSMSVFLQSQKRIILQINTSSYASQVNDNLFDGEWHHLAVTRASQDNQYICSIFLDGVLVGQSVPSTSVASISAGDLYFGGSSQIADFTGKLDSIRLWNVGRTQVDIQATMHYDLSGQENGLIGDWRFENGICRDAGPYANNGTLDSDTVSSSSVLLGMPQSEVALTGNAGYIDFGSGSGVTFADTSPFTVEMWICPKEGNLTGTLLAQAEGDQFAYGISVNNGVLSASRGSDSASAVTIMQPEEWYHLAATYDGAELAICVNGVKEGSVTSTLSLPSNSLPLTVGAMLASATQPQNVLSNCSLAFLRLWDTHRSLIELNQTMFQIFGGDTNHIVGMWNFTTPTLVDLSGNGNEGRLQGGASWSRTDFTTTPTKRSFLIQGEDSVISCGTNSSLAFSNMVTVECWVKLLATGNTTQTFVSKGDGYQLRYDGSTNQLNFFTKGLNTENLYGPANQIKAGEWFHLAGVYDKDTGTKLLYVNGVQVNSVNELTGTLNYGQSPIFVIGMRKSQSASLTNGWISEVRVWHAARSASDIALNWNRKISGNEAGPTASLKGYWALSDPATEVMDLSQNGNPGTFGSGAFIGISDFDLKPALPSIQAQSRLIQTWTQDDAKNDNSDGTSVYQTVLTLRDSNNNPMPGRRIRIWTDSDSTISVGDVDYPIGADKSAMFHTNATGRLTVTTVASNLSTPALKIWSDFMPESHRVIILPDDNLHTTLSSVEATALTTQRNGQPPLFDPSNASLNAAATPVAKAIRQTMTTINTPNIAIRSDRFMYKDRLSIGDAWQNPDVQSFHYVVQGDQPFQRNITPNNTVPNWSINFSGDEPVVTDHSSSEARAMIAAISPVHLDTLSTDDEQYSSLWQSWEDFKNGLKKAANVIITSVNDTVHVVVDWVEAGIKAISLTITSAYQAGQTVFGFVAQTLKKWGDGITNIADKIITFFRNIFDWEDMVITQKVLAVMIEDTIDAVIAKLDTFQTAFDQQMNSFEQKIHDYFNSIENEIGDKSITDMLGRYGGNNNDTAMITTHSSQALMAYHSHGVANNYLLDKFQSNIAGTSGFQPNLSGFDSSLWDIWKQFLEKAKATITTGAAIQAFQKAFNYFSDIFSNPGQFSNLLMKGMLAAFEGLTEIGVEFITIVTDLLFTMIKSVLILFKNMIKTPIQMPLVSWLFQKISGGESLTVLNLVTMIIAVPGTIVYKVVKGNKPFTQADLLWYQQHGMTPPPSGTYKVDAYNQPFKNNSETGATINSGAASAEEFLLFYGISYLLWGFIEPISDIQSIQDFNKTQAYQYQANTLGRQVFDIGGSPSPPMVCWNLTFALVPMVPMLLSWPPAGPGSSYDGNKNKAQELDFALWIAKMILACGGILTFGISIFSRKIEVYQPQTSSIPMLQAPTLLQQAGGSPATLQANMATNATRTFVTPSGNAPYNIMPIIYSLCGVIILGLSIGVGVEEIKDAGDDKSKKTDAILKLCQNICEAAPVCGKFLEDKDMIKTTEGLSLAVLLVIDLIGDEVAGILAIVRAAIARNTTP